MMGDSKSTSPTLILASGSPRRRELMAAMGLDFVVDASHGVDENYPPELPVEQVAEWLAVQKSAAYPLKEGDTVITADTVVIVGDDPETGGSGGEILGKPRGRDEAIDMLGKLSGATHSVITGVCVRDSQTQKSFSERTLVTFRRLTTQEIEHYVDEFEPFDKAGAYGIQEWIGHVGIVGIDGSYNNVVGLPTAKLYEKL